MLLLFNTEFRQGLRKILVRWPKVIYFPPPINSWSQSLRQTSLKSVFAIFHSLWRLFQHAYFVKCWRTLLKFNSVQWPPAVRKCKKINHKKVRFMSTFGSCLCFISPLHTWWDVIPYSLSCQLYFVYLAVWG